MISNTLQSTLIFNTFHKNFICMERFLLSRCWQMKLSCARSILVHFEAFCLLLTRSFHAHKGGRTSRGFHFDSVRLFKAVLDPRKSGFQVNSRRSIGDSSVGTFFLSFSLLSFSLILSYYGKANLSAQLADATPSSAGHKVSVTDTNSRLVSPYDTRQSEG